MDARKPASLPPRRTPPYAGWILAAAAAVVLLWFLEKTVTALLLIFFAMVVAIALTAPVRWLMRRGLSRRWAAGVSLIGFFATILIVAALVTPRLVTQVGVLVNHFPAFITRINQQLSDLLERYPDLRSYVHLDGSGGGQVMPSAINLLGGLGGFSLSLLGIVALVVLFFSSVIYAVMEPQPILRFYLGSLPHRHRAAGLRAYRRAVSAVIGWSEAAIVIGVIQSLLVFIFLSYMHVPTPIVWAALAFFAEFIPRIGGYIMAFPPMLLSLTVNSTAPLWVGLYYFVSNEIFGSLVAPRIRGTTMQLHPLLLLFFTLAFALAFGILGAIVATPAAAFLATYYDEFYLKRTRRVVH